MKLLYPADTNIVFFNVQGFAPAQFAELAQRHGVRFSAVGAGVRAVTHLDVTQDQIERSIEIVEKMLAE